MKRPIAIIVALIILTAIIGFERFGAGLQPLLPDDRTTRERRAGETKDHPSTTTKESDRGRQGLSGSDSHPSEQPHAGTAALLTNPSENEAIEWSINGEISPVHFIRASSIVGTDEPSEEQIDRLHQAVDIMAGALHPGIIIFDADAISTSDIPVLLFAREQLDLTSHVKPVYEILEKKSTRFDGAANLEEVSDKKPPTHPDLK